MMDNAVVPRTGDSPEPSGHGDWSSRGRIALLCFAVAALFVVVKFLAAKAEGWMGLWLAVIFLTCVIGFLRLAVSGTRSPLAQTAQAGTEKRADMGVPRAPAVSASLADPEGAVSASPIPMPALINDAGASGAEFEILAQVKAAINQERVDFYLQPIVSLPERRPQFYEAFSRLRDSEGRILTPADYLDAAEKANRINVIDNMILMRCIEALRRCRDLDPTIVVFCNLSPATLFDRDFFREFTDYLHINTDLAPNIVFEFTYPAIHMLHPRMEKHLQQLAQRGFSFSVDHIHSLNIDWAALRDKNFRYAKASARLLMAATHAADSAERLARHRARISDAGIHLIAEKIEREADMPEIAALGIDYGQGNLFGAPRPAHFYLGRVTGPVPAVVPDAARAAS